MQKCKVCGKENPPGLEYCEDCGASLTPPTAGATASSGAPAAAPATGSETIPQPATPAPAAPPQSSAATTPPIDTSGASGASDASDASGAPGAPTAPPTPSASPTPPGDQASAPPSAPPAAPGESKGPTGAAIGAALGAAAAGAALGAAAAGLAGGGSQSKNAGKPRLAIRRHGAPTGDEIPLGGDRLVVGRFDPETGPVDIDLSSAPEGEQISRQHGEFYREGEGQWFVRDLGSTNGVFVKAKSDTSFGPRITAPRALTNGDEVAFGNARFIFLTE